MVSRPATDQNDPGGPRRPISVRTYAALDRLAQAFGRGRLGFLMVVGQGGLGKTRAFRAAVGPNALWVEGHATAAGLYRSLWERRDRLVVIDDVDAVAAEPASVRLLRCLCQTEDRKRLAWDTEAPFLRRANIPREFTTASKVCLILNGWQARSPQVRALEDRATLAEFAPPPAEVHARAAAWFFDQEIYDWIGERLELAGRLSQRQYRRAWELKADGLDWQEALLCEWGAGDELIEVARLLRDLSYECEEDRVWAFRQAGHGSRATYYALKKRLQPAGGAPRATLTAKPPLPDWETAILLD